MKKKTLSVIKDIASGIFIGVANGAFGAGGGMIAVPYLKKKGFSQNKAQQNAVAVILPVTAVSAAVYLFKDFVNIKDSLIYLPTGLAGALIGTWLISRISPVYLKIVFGGFMVYAGGRLVLR